MEKETDKKEKKPNVFKQTFALMDKDKPLDKYLPVVMLLRNLNVILTSIYGLLIGVFGPLMIMMGSEDPAYGYDIANFVWLFTSLVYVFGIFIIMLGNSKAAAAIHVIAAGGTLFVFFRYIELYKEFPDTIGPVGMYLPCLGITVLSIAITLLINIPKHNKAKKLNAKAPSIFDDKE